MADDLGAVVDELVTRFNESQDGIVVNATYQGSYDDTYNALLAAFETGTEPNIVQNFDLASQTMIDTGRLVAAHDLMAADGYDSSVFVPAVSDYYGDGPAWWRWRSTAPPDLVLQQRYVCGGWR
ncbi:MAG: hypothetical protein R3D55_21645 [Chloroflexota bacterium]